MPRDRFKPKEFEDYRENVPNIDKYERRLNKRERTEKLEGDYAKSPQDVAEDYWGDIRREKEENPAPERKPRPYKKPRDIIRKFPKRYQRKEKRNTSRR